MSTETIAPAPRPTGRPTVRTPKVARKILECVKRGLPETMAVRAAGISKQTLISWKHDDPEFAERITIAEAIGLDEVLKEIQRLRGSKDEAIRLRANTWYAEHKFPQFFARSRLEIANGASDGPIIVLVWPHQQKQELDTQSHALELTNCRSPEVTPEPG